MYDPRYTTLTIVDTYMCIKLWLHYSHNFTYIFLNESTTWLIIIGAFLIAFFIVITFAVAIVEELLVFSFILVPRVLLQFFEVRWCEQCDLHISTVF
jgi:hypothetical protein